MSERQEQNGPRRSFLGPRIVGVVLLALGLLVLYQSFQIRQGGGYTVIGPRFFPVVVAIGLLLLSALFLLRATLILDTDLGEQSAAEEAATDWPTIGLTALVLVLYPIALSRLGYVLGTTIFFPLTARILGSRKPLRDLLVGIVLSLVIYIGFTQFLRVRLPAGLLDGIL